MAARTSGMAETTEAASPTSWVFSVVSSKVRGIEVLRGGNRCRAITRRFAGRKHRPRDCAVDQTRIEMAQRIMRREALAQRALPRARPVHRWQ